MLERSPGARQTWGCWAVPQAAPGESGGRSSCGGSTGRSAGRSACEPSPTSSQPLLAEHREREERALSGCGGLICEKRGGFGGRAAAAESRRDSVAQSSTASACTHLRFRGLSVCLDCAVSTAASASASKPKDRKEKLTSAHQHDAAPAGPVHPLQGLGSHNCTHYCKLLAAGVPGVFVRHRFPP